MALTRCPECSGQVPEQAVSCPHCGHPLAQAKPQLDEHWRERFRQIHIGQGLVAAILYLRKSGVQPAELRAFLEEEKAAGRIAKLPEP
jgi:hypothetical protein